jgi:protein-disulfide isomerase
MRAWLGTVLRLVVGVVWLWAGLDKLHSPREFVQAVRAYDATPEWLSQTLGYGLPVLAISLGILLIVGITVRLTAALSALLLLVILIGLLQAAGRGLQINTGRLGTGGLTLSDAHYALPILLAVLLLICAVFLVVWPATRISLEEFLARNDYVEPPSAKRMRSDQGQRKYQAQVAAKVRAAQVRTRFIHASLAIVVFLVAIIGIGVQDNRAKITGAASTDNVSIKYGVVYGKVAAARVDIYEDYQCAKCLKFEQAVRTTLEADVKANIAQVHYYTVAFFDAATGANDYSTRAANAAFCIADLGVDDFVKYHDILFSKGANGDEVQPGVGSKGHTDTDLVAYAKPLGLTAAQQSTFISCVQSKQYEPNVEALTEHVSASGVHAIPTVKVNGSALSSDTLAALKSAIADAGKKGPKPAPSKTPTPSPTPSSTSPGSAAAATPKPSGSPSAS